MSDSKLKQRTGSGFTLVELLIVIVVIAILAAITIVAYGNVSARAKTTQGSATAANVVKVAESYNTDNTTYPPSVAKFQVNPATTPTTQLPSGITLNGAGVIASFTATAKTLGTLLQSDVFSSAPADGNTVGVLIYCTATGGSSTGGAVYWWDFGSTPASAHVTYYGNAQPTTSTAAPGASSAGIEKLPASGTTC